MTSLSELQNTNIVVHPKHETFKIKSVNRTVWLDYEHNNIDIVNSENGSWVLSHKTTPRLLGSKRSY